MKEERGFWSRWPQRRRHEPFLRPSQDVVFQHLEGSRCPIFLVSIAGMHFDAEAAILAGSHSLRNSYQDGRVRGSRQASVADRESAWPSKKAELCAILRRHIRRDSHNSTLSQAANCGSQAGRRDGGQLHPVLAPKPIHYPGIQCGLRQCQGLHPRKVPAHGEHEKVETARVGRHEYDPPALSQVVFDYL